MDVSDTVLGYFLRSHDIITQYLNKKNLPSSVVILNRESNFEQAATISLRLALYQGRVSTFTSIFEGFPHLWTFQNLYDIIVLLIKT